jgi:hypothetical protein
MFEKLIKRNIVENFNRRKRSRKHIYSHLILLKENFFFKINRTKFNKILIFKHTD